MYLMETAHGEKAVQLARQRPPFGPGMDEKTASQTVKVEVWGSSFMDSGADFVEFRGTINGNDVWTRRVAGY